MSVTPEQELTVALSKKLLEEPWEDVGAGVIGRRKTVDVPGVGALTLRQACVKEDLSLWENSMEVYDPRGLANGIAVWRRDETGTDLSSAEIFLREHNEAG